MSEANQLSIATLFGGRTEQSALLGPPAQPTTPTSTPSMTHGSPPVAPTRSRARSTSTTTTDAFEDSQTTTDPAAKHVQSEPLFQNSGWYYPTQMQLKTAEEIQYEDIAYMSYESDPPTTPASPNLSPHSPNILDSRTQIAKVFINRLSYLNPFGWFSNRASASSTRERSVRSVDAVEKPTMFTQEHLGYEPFQECTEDELWGIEDHDGQGEHEDDGDALAPFNRLERKEAE
ncbi:MAG: hypothetical protein Q9178_005037 [Gyalolechia marmorata]